MHYRLLLVFTLFACTSLWSAPSESVEQKLIQLEKEWSQGLVTGDAAVTDRFEAADIVDTAPDGTVTNKTQDMEDIKSRKLSAGSVDMDDFKVQVYGHIAVVTGRITLKGAKYGSMDISGQYRFTDTWLHTGNKLQVVASQGTAIQKH